MPIQKRFINNFILLCLISFISVYGQDKGFLATFPTSVIPGHTSQFCIRFFNVLENVVINIYDQGAELFEPIQESIPSTKETCFGLKIHKSISDYETKTLIVSGETLNGDYRFNNSKIVSMKKISDLTFIETDKPVYKPGQKVQFRILTVNHELTPVDKLYEEIFIQDASNTRVFQWLNVENNAGLISLDLPISEEPNFGKWKISVSEFLKEDPIAVASFEVKKYVLPKFELQLKKPGYILLSDTHLTISACAKYSYGKDVKGIVDIKLYLKNSWQIKGKPFLQEGHKIRGCQEIVFNLENTEFSSTYMTELNVEATFTEDDTGLTAEANEKIDILRQRYKLELKDPKYFKPGLPAKIRIQIRTPDDKPVENKTLTMKISQGAKNLHQQQYISDSNGFVSIYFVSPSCENPKSCESQSQLYISVEVDEDIQNSRLVSSSTGFSLQPWSSKVDTFLQIYAPEELESVNCDDSLNLDIKLKTPEAPKGNLYFQVQSQSAVLFAGSFNLETNEKSASIDKNIFETQNVKINKIEKRQAVDVVYNIEICELPSDFDIENDVYDDDDDDDSDKEKFWYFNHNLKSCIHSKFETESEPFKKFQSEETCLNTCSSKKEESNESIKFEDKKENVATNSSSIVTSISMSILVDAKMSPEFSILAYYISGGEVIPDSIMIPVQKCLKNKVKLEIDEPVVKTGEEVKIKLTGGPKSVCAISAIDKSVSFMGKRNAIDLEAVYSKLSILKLDQDNFNNYPETEDCSDENDPIYNDEQRQARRIMSFYNDYDSPDAVVSFKNSGLIHFTDLKVYKKRHCYYYYHMYQPVYMDNAIEARPEIFETKSVNDDLERSSDSTTKIVREYFPETWLWNIEILNQNGVLELTKTSPDSITDWIFNAFCLSKEYSFGIAPESTLKVFRPLFVSVNLPYSVVSNETWPVQVSVFNYLNKCVPIKIDFKSGTSKKTCVCPDEKAFHTFLTKSRSFNTEVGMNVTITVSTIKEDNICSPSVGELANLDYSDTEIRNVLVEPEGINQEIVKSSFVFLNASENKNEFEISLPAHVVPNTVRGSFSAIGDPMGPAMNNLDNLVQLPTGCGEQNMIRFAPLVSVTKYLRDTAQLNSKVSELAKEYLKIGYQRQLTYIHSDGSYSAFGKSDTLGGGTWLTAFVLRCYAQSFGLDEILIDQKDIDISFKWLLSTQSSNGSFDSVGTKLVHKDLSGGLNDEKSSGLTAYVLITLLMTLKSTKVLVEYDENQIDKALLFLKTSIYETDNVNTYTLALCLYAFKLSEKFMDKGVEKEIEDQLEERAVIEGDMKYWTESSQLNDYKVQSSDIELTSYILLAKLVNFKNDDAASMVRIVKWINSQRNSLGGFYSTQDTVVALDALSKFASVFYSKKINLRINYSVNDILAKTVTINEQNRLLLQKINLKSLFENKTNKLNVYVNGSGSGLVQFSVKYNVKKEVKTEQDFDLKISFKNKKLEVHTKFNKPGKVSSMAIVNIRLPSGWIPIEESIEKLKYMDAQLKRYEINENKVSLYFDEISNSGKKFNFEITKVFDISNIKPGVASVYDYYESQENSVNQEFTLRR